MAIPYEFIATHQTHVADACCCSLVVVSVAALLLAVALSATPIQQALDY